MLHIYVQLPVDLLAVLAPSFYATPTLRSYILTTTLRSTLACTAARFGLMRNSDLLVRVHGHCGTGKCDPTNTMNNIPITIATLLTLTVRIKRVCIATQSSYLIQNNI